jgi:hypothetical protein
VKDVYKMCVALTTEEKLGTIRRLKTAVSCTTGKTVHNIRNNKEKIMLASSSDSMLPFDKLAP